MSTTAKPLRVAVLAHDGRLLGYVTRKPSNGSWRAMGRLPRVKLQRRAPARECTWGKMAQRGGLTVGITSGWVATLGEGEDPPADMEAP